MDLKDYPLEISNMNPDEVKEFKKYFKGLPSEFVRVGPKGYLFPKYENLMEQLLFFRNMQIRKGDTIIATFPRSGTTMTQELVWLLGNNLDYETASSKNLWERYVSLRTYKRNAKNIVEYKQKKSTNFTKLQRMTWPTAVLSDDDSDSRYFMTHFPICMLPPDTLDNAKIVYVARNPLDVVVSSFHLGRTLKLYEYVGDFKTYWNLFSTGLTMWSPYFAHVKEAWEKRHHANMLFLFYEDIIKDFPTAIQRISAFMNKNYSDEQIKGLCEHMKIENFKKNESVNLEFMKEFDGFVAFEQPFIRKGKTGGWRDYFDQEMMKQAASWIEDNLRDTDLQYPELDIVLKESSQDSKS